MRANDLLDRLDARLHAIEESGADGACPACAWHVADGPQHPTACPVGELRAIVDALDEYGATDAEVTTATDAIERFLVPA